MCSGVKWVHGRCRRWWRWWLRTVLFPDFPHSNSGSWILVEFINKVGQLWVEYFMYAHIESPLLRLSYELFHMHWMISCCIAIMLHITNQFILSTNISLRATQSTYAQGSCYPVATAKTVNCVCRLEQAMYDCVVQERLVDLTHRSRIRNFRSWFILFSTVSII